MSLESSGCLVREANALTDVVARRNHCDVTYSGIPDVQVLCLNWNCSALGKNEIRR
jgi:hypothetical protein